MTAEPWIRADRRSLAAPGRVERPERGRATSALPFKNVSTDLRPGDRQPEPDQPDREQRHARARGRPSTPRHEPVEPDPREGRHPQGGGDEQLAGIAERAEFGQGRGQEPVKPAVAIPQPPIGPGQLRLRHFEDPETGLGARDGPRPEQGTAEHPEAGQHADQGDARHPPPDRRAAPKPRAGRRQQERQAAQVDRGHPDPMVLRRRQCGQPVPVAPLRRAEDVGPRPLGHHGGVDRMGVDVGIGRLLGPRRLGREFQGRHELRPRPGPPPGRKRRASPAAKLPAPHDLVASPIGRRRPARRHPRRSGSRSRGKVATRG